MTFGDRIAIFRKAKSLSQEELANILNVSRQAVYKWEANQSTPELEKLIAMTSVFEVSLDELVTGEKQQGQEVVVNVESKSDKHFVSGIVFLTLGLLTVLLMIFLSGSLAGAVVGIPFIVCAALCFSTRKHTLLWCVWTFYISIDLYMRYATGLMPSHILHSLSWTYDMNYARLAIAWMQFIAILIMIALTVKALGVKKTERDKQSTVKLLAGVAAFAALYLINGVNLILKLCGDEVWHSILPSILREGYSVILMIIVVYIARMALGMKK